MEYRVLGLLLGAVVTLVGVRMVVVNAVQGVQATGLAGTFTVEDTGSAAASTRLRVLRRLRP